MNMRLTLLLTAASCACVLGAQHARAELDERLTLLGTQLEPFVEPGAQDLTLELNGQTLTLSTQTVNADLHTVMERFAVACARSTPQLTAELDRAQSGRHTPYLGILRQELNDHASALCIAQPDDASFATLASRAAAFQASGDLTVFGELRFMSARRNKDNDTHVIVAHTSGPLHLAAMFPNTGDAAGGDFTHLPRPVAARRVLSTQLSDQRYGMVAYEVSAALPVAFAHYRGQLLSAGLQVLPIEHADAGLAVFTRGSEQYVVHAFEAEGSRVLSVVRMGEHRQVEEFRHD